MYCTVLVFAAVMDTFYDAEKSQMVTPSQTEKGKK